jgi:hypothetical protein
LLAGAKTLVAAIARHTKVTRDAFTAKVADIISLMAAQIPQGSADERRRKAIAIYAAMVGALQLSRARPADGQPV